MSPTIAAESSPSRYQVTDRLYLWSLLDPVRPGVVGELNLVRSSQGVSLKYLPHWLEHGFELSEDLPLIDQEFLPLERNVAAGAVDDARPDRWGERVIRFIDKPARLSLLEYLYFAGDDRFGALGVSTSSDRYLPRRLGPLPTLKEADRIHELIRRVQDNEPIPWSCADSSPPAPPWVVRGQRRCSTWAASSGSSSSPTGSLRTPR